MILLGDALRPVTRILDYTAGITTAPLSFAARHITLGDKKSFRKAITFTPSCIPVGMVLQRLALVSSVWKASMSMSIGLT
jgi:hypothetical protein